MDKDLKKVIGEGSKDILTVDHIKFIMYQLMAGLKFVHSAHVIHRDLKPANILMKVDDCSLKIADFGLSRVIDETLTRGNRSTTNITTKHVVTRW